MTEPEEPALRFTTKEMLVRIDTKVDTVMAAVNNHETRISVLEAERKSSKTSKDEWHMRLYVAASIAAALAAIISVIVR